MRQSPVESEEQPLAGEVTSEAAVFEDPALAIAQGRRNLLVHDYSLAVSAFASGCQLLAERHGDTADELGEPYLLYGRALLCLAREEAGVLGLGVPGQEDDDEADEAEDNEDAGEDKPGEVTEKEKPSNNEAKAEEAPKAEEVKPVEEPKESSEPEAAGSSSSAGGSSSVEAAASGSAVKMVNGDASTSAGPQANGISHDSEDEDETSNNDNEEDESTNLQLAWEVLELAKLIILKRGQASWKLLAEAHRLLGEVAMESGNQIGALTDLTACLDLLGRIEPYDPRGAAETHYQLGLAYSLGNEFDSSIEQFQKATSLLEKRVAELEALTDKTPTTDDEIKELKELLPEIQDKIADMRDFKQEACKAVIEKIKSTVASGSCSNGAGPSSADASGASSSSSVPTMQEPKPVSDISHLVRKKRKPEDSELDSGSPCKKPTPEKV